MKAKMIFCLQLWSIGGKMRKVSLACLILCALFLSGCVGGYSDPYIQRSVADGMIQATQDAQYWQMQQATLAAAQTQSAFGATQTEIAVRATATAQEIANQVAQASATASAESYQATATTIYQTTATAWPQTATPLAATQSAIVRDAQRAERREVWAARLEPITQVAPTLIVLVIVGLLIAGAILSWRRFAPVLELRWRSFERANGDSPLTIFADMVIDPDKMFDPALRLGDGARSVNGAGGAPLPELQARTSAQAQLVRAIRALPQGERKTATRMLQAAGGAQSTQQAQPPARPVIEVLEPGEGSDVGAWLSEVNHKLAEENL